jgi:F0F1-type ATP synthase assembly protein I
MSALSSQTLRSRAEDRLAPHGSEGLRTSLAGVVDLEALDAGQYEEVLSSIDARLSTAHYSLVSMLVAGIYFGLLVGHWLFALSPWSLVVRWVVPVLLVTVYAVYASYQTLQEIHALTEARALLTVLDQEQGH